MWSIIFDIAERIFQAVRGSRSRIWPNRQRWLVKFKHNQVSVIVPELQKVIQEKDERLYWTSPEPQAPGDSIIIELGKYRIIDGIEFYEKTPDNCFPEYWTILLEGEWGELVQKPIDGEGRIVREFPPTRIHAIEVKIRQPLELGKDGAPYHWRISIVYLREVRLFRRWFRVKI